MANNEGKAPQKVNPLLLIVLGVAVVAVGINYILSKPKDSPVPVQTPIATPLEQPSPNPSESTTPVQSVTTADPIGTKENSSSNDTESNPKTLTYKASNRNPFLTPSIYLTTPNNSPANNQPNNAPDKTSTTPQPNDSKNTTNVAPEPEIRLGAVFMKADDKVALVYYKGKGFILREEDRLKGTDLRVKSISRYSVTIVDLTGEESVLKLSEKALKLKGGGQ